MTCSACGHEAASATARFCAECGARLGSEPEPAPARTHIDVSTTVGSGDATGLRVDRIDGPVSVVHNNVFHIRDPSPELLREFGSFKAVSMEVTPGGGEAGGDSVETRRIAALEARVDEVLQEVRDAERRGERVDEVRVGDVRLSRVELLVKQAVLLKAEADQMFFDRIRDNQSELDRMKSASTGATFEIDLGRLLDGFDQEARAGKLQDARRLLEEACRLEPTNAEVLLHLAQVVDQLDEDPHETRRILGQVLRLLDPPRDDTERFHLAQAKFLSAVAGETVHTDALRAARDMFRQLGRTDWVRHCDDLLGTHPVVPVPPRGNFAAWAPAAPAPFQPVGQWHARMGNGGALGLTLHPGGSLQGIQSPGMFGFDVPFAGQWHFDPGSGALWMQGVVGGTAPFALQIAIQGEREGGWLAIGSDGMQYFLTRAV
jgi:hypothetical protein